MFSIFCLTCCLLAYSQCMGTYCDRNTHVNEKTGFLRNSLAHISRSAILLNIEPNLRAAWFYNLFTFYVVLEFSKLSRNNPAARNIKFETLKKTYTMVILEKILIVIKFKIIMTWRKYDRISTHVKSFKSVFCCKFIRIVSNDFEKLTNSTSTFQGLVIFEFSFSYLE